MKVAIIAKFNKFKYQEEVSIEQALQNTREMLEGIKEEKENGVLLEVYGLPGEDSTMWIYEVASLEALDDLFMNDGDKYLTYELHYLSDFEKVMAAKLEKGVV